MSKLPRIHSWDIKESVGISLLSIRKMGPPLEALSPPDAFGRSGEETPGRFWTRGVYWFKVINGKQNQKY